MYVKNLEYKSIGAPCYSAIERHLEARIRNVSHARNDMESNQTMLDNMKCINQPEGRRSPVALR